MFNSQPFGSINPNSVEAGDEVVYHITLYNVGGQPAQIESIQIGPPTPPHFEQAVWTNQGLPLNSAIGEVIMPGETGFIGVLFIVPTFYAPELTYPFTLTINLSSGGADCNDITTIQANLPITLKRKDRKPPTDPTAAFDGRKLLELPSTDIPIPTISSNGNGGANGGGGPGFDEPGSGDPHGGGGIFDGGNGSNGNGSDGDANGSGGDIKIKIIPPTGNPENSFWLGGGGTGPSSGGGDDDVIPDTPPSINWCTYGWVGYDGLVTVGTVYSYWGANEDNIWNILPTALYDYLAEYVEGGATLANFIEVYFIEEGPLGGYVSYQCSVNGNGNGLIYDVNGDGVVNLLDLLTLDEFIQNSNGGYDPAYDFNDDGSVDMLDYTILGDNMPDAPFDICEFLVDGAINNESQILFNMSEFVLGPDSESNMEYFMSFYGMTSEQIGCRDPEDE